MIPDGAQLSNISREATRRDLIAMTGLAATTTTAGCISSRGLARGIAAVKLYNPTARPRTVHVIVVGSDQTLIDTRATVPPRASLGLAEDVLMEQTVEVRVEHDGLSTVYEWNVQTSLTVTLGADTRFQTEGVSRRLRELPGSGRVDVRLGGEPGATGMVRIDRSGETVFATEREFSVGSSVTYHDRLEATGEVMVTLQGTDGELSRSVSVDRAGQVAANLTYSFIKVYEPPTEE